MHLRRYEVAESVYSVEHWTSRWTKVFDEDKMQNSPFHIFNSNF